MFKLNPAEEPTLKSLIDRAFKEDVHNGDVTTNSIVGESVSAEAHWKSKQKGTVAGIDFARNIFERLDPRIQWNSFVADGDEVEQGNIIVKIKGSCRAILTAERIALNIVQRMSGIATMTKKYVREIKDYPTKILDTRKTVPGLRLLDKYAVSAGEGANHRMGLFDLAMIKDNHIVAAGGIGEAVQKVRRKHPDLKIEVETTNLTQLREALLAEADIIMLDNMGLEMMEEGVSIINDKSETEASGNITLEDVREIAKTGVDYISIGALTHSVKAFDISQELKQIFK